MQEVGQPLIGEIGLTTLVCSKNKQAHMICITKDCKNYALSCRQTDCPCQTEEHLSCDFRILKGYIKTLFQKRKKIPEETLKAVQYLQGIYEGLIQQLSINKQGLSNWKQYYGLTRDQINVLLSLKSQDREILKGQQTFNAIRSEFLKPDQASFTKQIIKKYWESKEWIVCEIFQQLRIPYQPKQIDQKVVQRFVSQSHKMKWGRFFQSDHVKIEDSSIICTEGKQTIQLLTPFFIQSKWIKQKKIWSFSIVQVSKYNCLKIGICLYHIAKKNLYKRTQKNHGCYLFSQNGNTYQHHKEQNELVKNSEFNTGDIVHLIYDQNKNLLSLSKNLTSQVINLRTLDPPPEDFYCPCVILNKGATVKILYIDLFSIWRQSTER